MREQLKLRCSDKLNPHIVLIHLSLFISILEYAFFIFTTITYETVGCNKVFKSISLWNSLEYVYA